MKRKPTSTRRTRTPTPALPRWPAALLEIARFAWRASPTLCYVASAMLLLGLLLGLKREWPGLNQTLHGILLGLTSHYTAFLKARWVEAEAFHKSIGRAPARTGASRRQRAG